MRTIISENWTEERKQVSTRGGKREGVSKVTYDDALKVVSK